MSLLCHLIGQPSSSSDKHVSRLELATYIRAMEAMVGSWVSDLGRTSPEYQALLSKGVNPSECQHLYLGASFLPSKFQKAPCP